MSDARSQGPPGGPEPRPTQYSQTERKDKAGEGISAWALFKEKARQSIRSGKSGQIDFPKARRRWAPPVAKPGTGRKENGKCTSLNANESHFSGTFSSSRASTLCFPHYMEDQQQMSTKY